ncbi:hypothetical protein [Streptomyces tagetis]|uniref:Uncharacterized protein n=1 Tax=Streptomyces tagetis TaxID=2820809 RepID=A0A940XHQ8_9ACTN|nr:hypothetical protein [Streptomyces sp. RG38]MBQ0826776.1 hypothetical protein [Streptomyces sp. RG38]
MHALDVLADPPRRRLPGPLADGEPAPEAPGALVRGVSGISGTGVERT